MKTGKSKAKEKKPKDKVRKIAKGVIKGSEAAECKDSKCPEHGGLKVRGRSFKGKIVKMSGKGTVKVEWPRVRFFSKYERFAKMKSSVQAHLPLCLGGKVGDEVRIQECRPLSKTKHFVVTEILRK